MRGCLTDGINFWPKQTIQKHFYSRKKGLMEAKSTKIYVQKELPVEFSVSLFNCFFQNSEYYVF
jgi:hypothetical protein